MKLLCATSLLGAASALTISQINGNRYTSPYDGKSVTNVTGLVTAVTKLGVYLRSVEPDTDPSTSEGLYVFDSAFVSSVSVGDVVTINGKVSKYRSNKNYIYATEFTKPAGLEVKTRGNAVTPRIIGKDTLSPPTEKFSSLDAGGIFGVPNAVTTVSEANPVLDPTTYGLDFWQSLLGELVTVRNATQTTRPNKFGDVWVRGDWKATGVNKQGGITMLEGDANPEAITIGSPLDGSQNPLDSKMGDFVGDITGVVNYAFGTYRILPLTSIAVSKPSSAEFPPVAFTSAGTCQGITVGDYNCENLMPNSAHMPKVIDQIITKLRTPDLLFLQEVQDNSGDANDGTTSANVTLATLANGIEAKSGVKYAWAEVEPVNNQDGGQPGGNIRCAYLYRPDVIQLYKPNQGGSLDAAQVVKNADGMPEITLNPGRIDPKNTAWDNSRKPLVAMWKVVKGTKKLLFTINVHNTSKGGSTGLHGDVRPPLNKGVEKRTAQAEAAAVSLLSLVFVPVSLDTAGSINSYKR